MKKGYLLESLIERIKEHRWWRQANRDLEQLPLFIIVPFIKANYLLGVNTIALSKEGLIESYKIKDEVFGLSKRFDINLDTHLNKLRELIKFCKKQRIRSQREALKALIELRKLLDDYCPLHHITQLWGFSYEGELEEKQEFIEANKEKIVFIRNYPIFRELVSLLEKTLSTININREEKKRILSLTMPEEFINIIKKGKISKELLDILKKRQKGFILWMEKDTIHELNEGGEVRIIENLIQENLEESLKVKKTNKIVGRSNFKGKINGRVKKVLRLDELSKVEKGDILVSKAITPEYTIILDKVRAIIVDEEGLLSHIQTIAREFNKPFISDTKIASSILEDGQFIEINNNIIYIKNRDKASSLKK